MSELAKYGFIGTSLLALGAGAIWYFQQGEVEGTWKFAMQCQENYRPNSAFVDYALKGGRHILQLSCSPVDGSSSGPIAPMDLWPLDRPNADAYGGTPDPAAGNVSVVSINYRRWQTLMPYDRSASAVNDVDRATEYPDKPVIEISPMSGPSLSRDFSITSVVVGRRVPEPKQPA